MAADILADRLISCIADGNGILACSRDEDQRLYYIWPYSFRIRNAFVPRANFIIAQFEFYSCLMIAEVEMVSVKSYRYKRNIHCALV